MILKLVIYRGSGATASPVDEKYVLSIEKRTWAPHNRYFPIPQNDLNVNKKSETE